MPSPCGRGPTELPQESARLAGTPLPKALLKGWFGSRDSTHSLILPLFQLFTSKAQDGREEKLLRGEAAGSAQTGELEH